MALYARIAVFRTTVTLFVVASALIGADLFPAAATEQATPCPRGRAAVIDVAYVIFHSDGSSNNVSTLRGNVSLGDTVNALFNVPALPSGCSQVQLSLASYSSSGPAARHKQSLFSVQAGEFLPGGRYEMSVTVVPSPAQEAPRANFTVDFATGAALARPHSGPDLIASARS